MKPVWLLLGIVGLGAWIALTRNHVYATPTVDAELERPSALGAGSLEPDDEAAPQQMVDARAAAPAADAAGEPHGEVLETQDVASYTYLRLKTAAGEVWAAVPRATVRVHDQVQVVGASLMRDFESKTLKRTFPSIYFGSLAGVGAAAGDNAPRTGPVRGDEPLPPGHPPIGSVGADPYAPGTPLPPGHPRVDAL